MAEQRLTQNAKQTNDATRLHRTETQPEQEEQVVQTEAARLQRVMANPAGADPDDITGLQQTVGNRAVSQLLTSVTGPAEEPVIQAKLMVGAPGDKFEREADQMADKVMATVVPAANQPDDSGPGEARRQPAAEGTIQRFQTLAQIDEAIRKRKERAKNRAQQKKNPPNTQTPLQQTVQNNNAALVGSGTEAEKQQKQKTRWEVGNEYSRRNMKRMNKLTHKSPEEKQPQQSQPEIRQPEQHNQPAKNITQPKTKVITQPAGAEITAETIKNAITTIREGTAGAEEIRKLKQFVRDNYFKVTTQEKKQVDPLKDKPQGDVVTIDKPQGDVVEKEEPEEEAELAAMATVAMEKATEKEAAEEEAEEAKEEIEAEEEEAEEAAEEEAEEEEETEEAEQAGEIEATEDELEELGVTDWPLSVLLAKSKEPSTTPHVQREVTDEIKSTTSEIADELKKATSFGYRDKPYQFDANKTEKRAATTRIAREEPGIPGLKGVSEEVWLKPLAGLMRQPVQTNDETETAPSNNDGSFEVEDTVEQRLRQQKGKGQPLPTGVRSDMETRFGADFGQVRIHTGSEAAQLSETLHAQAFTHGNDIFFNAGKSNFDTTEDKKLLAHELTHVIQQMGYGKKDDSGNG